MFYVDVYQRYQNRDFQQSKLSMWRAQKKTKLIFTAISAKQAINKDNFTSAAVQMLK